MRYYIIAGEASGDLHGSNLIKELRLLDGEANITCWGGEKMEAAGASLVKHYSQLAFMGFAEVIKNLPTIFKNISFCKKDITAYKPDILILIDYPGFNLRIAKWAKQQQIKVVYYISPQVWAWKANRVKMMRQCIDKMICILPFEKKYYKEKWDWEVAYVGHPLVKVIDDFLQTSEERRVDWEKNTTEILPDGEIKNYGLNAIPPLKKDAHLIALLPGSRRQEILIKLPIMLQVANYFPDYFFVVAKAPGIAEDFYEKILQPYKNVSCTKNNTYQLLASASAALVTSGTATLETALFAVPEIICYKGSPISYRIAKKLLKIKFIGLVNLIMDKAVVKELIQGELTPQNIKLELEELLFNENKKQQLQQDYQLLKQMLCKGGNASANAAKIVYEFLKN
jgi:lipid-A-disaccharide synthase